MIKEVIISILPNMPKAIWQEGRPRYEIIKGAVLEIIQSSRPVIRRKKVCIDGEVTFIGDDKVIP